MNPSRRAFIHAVSRLGVLLGFHSLAMRRADAASVSEELKERTLEAFLDTLIPADETSPSASEVGIDRKFLMIARQNANGRKLLNAGLTWLNEQAKKAGARNFAALTGAQRERIVRRAEQAEQGTVPHLFFTASQNGVFFHYYAEPESWPAIHYDGPPQPLGFLDYSEPPAGGE